MVSYETITHWVLSHVPVKDLEVEALKHLNLGKTPGQVVDLIAEKIDSLVDFRKVIPGFAGAFAEEHDGELFRAIGHLIVAAVQRRPPPKVA